MLSNNFKFFAEGGGQFVELLDYFVIDKPFLIAQVINFTLVAYILYRFAIKPVLATLDVRQKKITDGLQYAEEMKKVLADTERQHAEKLTEASRKAQSIIDDAKASSESYLEKQKQKTTLEIEQMFQNARDSIEKEKQQVLQQARLEIASLVVQTCEKVLKKDLTDDDKSRYNATATSEIQFAQTSH